MGLLGQATRNASRSARTREVPTTQLADSGPSKSVIQTAEAGPASAT